MPEKEASQGVDMHMEGIRRGRHLYFEHTVLDTLQIM